MQFTSITSTRLWRRLGQPNAIGLPILAVTIVFNALLSFAFDAVRLQNITWLWVPINLLAIGLVLMVALPVLAYKRKMNPTGKQQPLFNISLMSLSFGAKNLSMLYLAPAFGIYDEGIPAVRFVGGLTLGLSILILYTNIAGSRLERERSLAKLMETETDLRSFRLAAFDQLEEENHLAALKTSKALTPQIEELKKSLQQSKDIMSLANKLTSFIKNELRPFGSQLSDDAIALAGGVNTSQYISVLEPEPRINLSKAIRVGITFLPIPFLAYFVSSFAIPSATGVDIMVSSLIFLLTLSVLKLAVSRVSPLSPDVAFVAITVIAFLAALPSFYLISQIPNLNGVPELLPVFFIIPGWSVIAASQAYILDQKQSRIERELNEVVQELARENKLFEQKAWLARHGWYLLIHGVVQPAITTAAIRVSNASELTAEVKSEVLSDLQRALDSLVASNPSNQSLSFNVSEIQSVWAGICEIDVSIGEGVSRHAAQDLVANQVINEILKEIVSNAVRHGNATKVEIRLDFDGPKDIEVFALNNGSKPFRDRVESVGSRMLEALCLNRSLQWNSATKMTEFKALIPIK